MFSLEFGVDARGFCNYFERFYYADDFTSAFKLIRPKHIVGVSHIKLKLPTKHDPEHNVSFTLQSQNDVKKQIGVSTIKLADTYNWNKWIVIKNTLNLKSNDWQHSLKFHLKLLDDKLGFNI